MDEHLKWFFRLTLYFILTLICFTYYSFGADNENPAVIQDSLCYSCMSPETNIRNVRKNQNREQILDAWTMVLKNMPHQKTQECNTFANSSTLSKQPCPNQFCVKFIIDDKDGSPFVMRFCADQFKKGDTLLQEICNTETLEWETGTCFCKGNLCNGSANVVSILIIHVFTLCFLYFIRSKYS